MGGPFCTYAIDGGIAGLRLSVELEGTQLTDRQLSLPDL